MPGEGKSQGKLWRRLVSISTGKSFLKLRYGSEKTNRTVSLLVPSAVSLRITGAQQLYQVKRTIRGCGNVL